MKKLVSPLIHSTLNSLENLIPEYSSSRHPLSEVSTIPMKPIVVDNHPSSTTFTWKIENFSTLNKELYWSDSFLAGGDKWRIVVYFKGGTDHADYLSIYLNAADWVSLPLEWSRDVEYSLRVINQIEPNKTRSHGRAFRRFSVEYSDWGFKSFIPLSELRNPNRGYLVNDTCIIEAEVLPRSLGDIQEETVIQHNATQRFEIQEAEDPALLGTNSRTSSITPPPANIPKPSSTLKTRSNIAHTVLQVFMAEFDSNFPTYEKFGKVMEDLRASMYGGNMGDIFEEWRPHILEIEALLAGIEDLEQECKDDNPEAPLREELLELLESLNQFGQVSTHAEEEMAASLSLLDSKRQELRATQQKLTDLGLQMAELRLQMAQLLTAERNIKENIYSEESAHAKATSEKEEADKEIKKLDQQKKDMTKNIEAVQNRTETRRRAIAEKKALVQEWITNPLLPLKNP